MKVLETENPDLSKAMSSILENVYQGNEGKITTWMNFNGMDTHLAGHIDEVVAITHQLRQSLNPAVEINNTKRILMFVALALVGEVVAGDQLKKALDFDHNDSQEPSFRDWLAEFLINFSGDELL